jgi:outer membrane lipoprotein-sorting protein
VPSWGRVLALSPAPRLAAALSALALLGPDAAATPGAAAAAVEGAPSRPESANDAHLTGRDIYDRVTANRFRSVVQESTLRSADRGGREQVTRLRLHWKDYRDDSLAAERGILSKTLVKYSHPFDIRHSGYLVIHNDERADDQFVYLPERRKVVRVNLRSEAVFGTDFSFEDILPREAQDATYQRLEDDVIAGVPTFTVEAIPTDFANSEYSRFLVYVEKARYVPLRTRYWDEAGVEVKEMRVDPSSIELHDGVWLPMRVTMRHLLYETSTSLEVTHLEPNPELPRSTFALQRLESH